MPVEEIIKELRRQDKVINDALITKQSLYEQLVKAGTEDFDWITVQTASKILGVSVGTIYNKINTGELNTKHINSSVRVSKKEILAIDDKEVRKRPERKYCVETMS